MILAGFLSLLLLTGGSTNNSSEHLDVEDGSTMHYQETPTETEMPEHTDWTNCSQVDVINHLNLTDQVKYAMTRPVKNYQTKTTVTIVLSLYAILDVKEKEQKLVSYIWTYMFWTNEFISWKCDLPHVYLPVEMLWTPDIIIEEMTEKDKGYQSPYLVVERRGMVLQRNAIVLTSSCRMHFYKFPFDTQTCNLTFKSVIFTNNDLILEMPSDKGSKDWTIHDMKDISEWVLVDTSSGAGKVDHSSFPTMAVVFSMTIRRRSVLYVVNFILPILFFLFLDLASFLISEHGGEKLSFKVTVLLAVTVMQLILNEILPSSSDRIPLIAEYCIGIFSLMMMSLLETILVMYLMERDSAAQDKETETDQPSSINVRGKVQNCLREKLAHCACACNISSDETTSELQPEAKEGSSSRLTKESCELDNLSRELREVKLLLNSQKEEGRPGYWTGKIKMINRIYLTLYVTGAGVFLYLLFSRWVDEKIK